MALDTNPTIYVARNALAGWVLTDDTHIYGAYRTLRAAKADLRLLQAGRLVAKVTDEGKGFLAPAPVAPGTYGWEDEDDTEPRIITQAQFQAEIDALRRP